MRCGDKRNTTNNHHHPSRVRPAGVRCVIPKGSFSLSLPGNAPVLQYVPGSKYPKVYKQFPFRCPFVVRKGGTRQVVGRLF